MSDLLAEVEALRDPPDGGVVVDRSDRGFVRVTGPDALTFLQVLVSADLEPLADGDAIESLLLQPQGKLDVAFRLLRVAADDLWLDTDPGLAPRLAASLERFKIRVDVVIEDVTGTFGMLSLGRPGFVPAEIGDDDERPPNLAASTLGYDMLGPLDDVRDVLAAGSALVVGADAWEAFRIERGIPVQPADIDDTTIPQEAELEVDAVSFTKGCFIGQELVCRIDSRGHVNRFLRRLTAIDGPRPAVGDEIVSDGKVVGAVTSVTPDGVPVVALGYVRREVDPGATVELRGASGTSTATVATRRP